jgi:hypothetical protein
MLSKAFVAQARVGRTLSADDLDIIAKPFKAFLESTKKSPFGVAC